MSPSSRPDPRSSRWLSPRLVIGLVTGLALLVGVGVWADALAEPVVRAGVPTGSVTLPPPKPTATRSSAAPSPTQSGSTKPSEKPSTTAKPSPKPTKAAGKFDTSKVTRKPVSGTGKQYRFIVKVQASTGLDADKVAGQVADVLNDPRSWAGSGTVRFALVMDAAKADFTVFISDPQAADAKCGKDAAVCVRGQKLVLGAAGWKKPATTYGEDATGFRRYLVNNAVGAYLGEGKASCKKAGRPAPVMAPQTTDLKGCTPNPWVFS